ncbi:MAG TPA: substrate-binding domain-containing protein [Ktedonobacteraceae bacterium]
MPVQWNLKQWMAVNRQIYRPADLQALLEEKAGVQLSWQAVSALLNNTPGALRLSTIQALCNALDCKLSDFCEVAPDQRLTTISVLIPSWVWHICPDLTSGLVDAVGEHEYDISLYSLNDEDDPRNDNALLIERFLATPQIAGLVAVFPGADLSTKLTQLARQGFPVVIIDDQEVQVLPSIGVDNATGAYLATRHLLQLGHRRIAHIKGPAKYLVSYARYQGYCRALIEAGLLPDPALILEGDFLPPSGRTRANQLLALPVEKRPTAIFSASDQMAYGVLAAAEERGLTIPGDLALVSFDDDYPSAYTHPPLTTVRQPYFAMGQQAIALLFSLLSASTTPAETQTTEQEQASAPAKDAPYTHPLQVQLQPSLIVRQSCGATSHRTIHSTDPKTL